MLVPEDQVSVFVEADHSLLDGWSLGSEIFCPDLQQRTGRVRASVSVAKVRMLMPDVQET